MVARQRLAPRAAQHVSKTDAREPVHEAAHSEPRRIRRRKADAVEDQFYIPVNEIPEHLSYEWKRFTVKGEEDPFYLASMRDQGWEPVPPKRHPNWLPPGYSQPHIIKGGLILCDRPKELTEEARRETQKEYKQRMREAEIRLGKATNGEEAERIKPRIQKEYVRPMAIQEDD